MITLQDSDTHQHINCSTRQGTLCNVSTYSANYHVALFWVIAQRVVVISY